jgi:hypothetical protein
MGMGILSIIAQSTYKGYPVEVFYAAGFVGLALIVFRPYWAFLFAVFCLAGRNFHAAVFTRTEALGAFLNLNDLFMWICVLALGVFILKRKTFWAPKVLIALFIINYLAAMQSFFQYGFESEVLRAVWAAAIFPVMFLVGANLVTTEKDAYQIYWALFLGAVVAALQHLVFINIQLPMVVRPTSEEVFLRSISYIMSGGMFLVVSAIFIKGRLGITRRLLYWLWLAGLVLITFSYILSLTRTVWVGVIAAGIGVFFWTISGQRINYLSRSLKIGLASLLILGGIFTVSTFFFPSLDLKGLVEQRTEAVQRTEAFDEAYKTREQGFESEINIWLNSWLILGGGTALPPAFWHASTKNVGALRHVALSAYLACFGVLGLVVYWVWLPFATIKAGRSLFLAHKSDYLGALALAAMAVAFYDFATILSSNHYLGAGSHINGLIYGAFWGLARGQTVRAKCWNPVPLTGRYWQKRTLA